MGLGDEPTRHIRLIRHGKSADGRVDHQRPLNHRGSTDGANMQNWCSRQPHQANWVWSSDAVRARSTAEFVAAGFEAELILEPELYLADPETILNCLRSTPDDVTSVALVAHNPGITYCANMLCGRQVTDNMVTFAVALMAHAGDWPALNFGTAEYLSLHTPKQIAQATR